MAPTRSSRNSGADTDTSMADASEIRQLPVDPMVRGPPLKRSSLASEFALTLPIHSFLFTSTSAELTFLSLQEVDETPDYTEDSDTNPNTTASSVVGEAITADGRKRRSEATQLRRSVFGKKHDILGESKVCYNSEC